MVPEDDAFQTHFHGTPGSDPKMAFVFQMLGVGFCTSAFVKIVSVFIHHEGTFLRQKLFFGLAVLDFVMAYVVHGYKALPPSVLDGFAAMHAAEGLALLAVALFKERPLRARDSKKPK